MTNKADYIGYVSNVACLHVLVFIVLTTDRPLQGLEIMSPQLLWWRRLWGIWGTKQSHPIYVMTDDHHGRPHIGANGVG